MNRRIGQIAISVNDQTRSTDFYADVFGMDHIFGTSEFRGPDVDQVQKMKNVASSTRWLIDDREMFQLEVFKFENPVSRPLDNDHSVTHEGYNRIIVAVNSVEETSQKAVSAGARVIALLPGEHPGCPTHTLLSDPDGILVELVEAPELVPDKRPAILIGLGITSRDMNKTVVDMCEGFGFSRCEDRFQHEAFMRESGTLEGIQTLRLDDMYLVVSQYQDCKPRAADYRLGDIGIMNFAICFPDAADFDRCYEQTKQMGMQANIEPVTVGDTASVTYNNDRQGFSVEMIYMAPKHRGMYGFTRPDFTDRLLSKLVNWKSRRAYKKHLAASSNSN